MIDPQPVDDEVEIALDDLARTYAAHYGCEDADEAIRRLARRHSKDPEALEARLRKLLGWHP